MDIQQLNDDFCQLVSLRNLLASLNYNDSSYDQVEEDLHDFEDSFLDKYGDYLEKAFQSVHDKYCPDIDVLLPVAYIAKKYIEKTSPEGEMKFGVGPNEGILIDADKFPGRDVRLFLVPSPTRIVMTVDNAQPNVVWQAE